MSFSRSLTWLMPLGLLTYAMVSLPVRILSEEGYPRYHRLSEQLERVTRDNAMLKRDIARLNREVDALRHDPDAIEQIARDDLGLIAKDEVLFEFEPE